MATILGLVLTCFCFKKDIKAYFDKITDEAAPKNNWGKRVKEVFES